MVIVVGSVNEVEDLVGHTNVLEDEEESICAFEDPTEVGRIGQSISVGDGLLQLLLLVGLELLEDVVRRHRRLDPVGRPPGLIVCDHDHRILPSWVPARER